MNVLHVNSNFLYTSLYEKMISNFNNSTHKVFSPVRNNFPSSVSPKEYLVVKKVISKIDRYFFLKKSIKILKSLESSIDVQNYNVVHAHTLFTDGNIAYKIKKKYGIPYILAIRNTDINFFFKYRINLRKLGVSILLNASKIIFLSQTYLNQLLELYIPKEYKSIIYSKSCIIPNGIDDFWFENKALIEKSTIEEQNIVQIVYAGKINKNKNLLKLKQALDILNLKGIKTVLNIAGEIENNRIYSELCDFPNLKYYGILSKDDLLQLYRKSHIFVMPSYTETFGLVYAEAMSQGLPVIYTKGQGFDRQFQEGIVGYHVDPYNPYDIASKLELVIQNIPKYSSNSLSKVDKFKWKDLALIYEAIYEEVRSK